MNDCFEQATCRDNLDNNVFRLHMGAGRNMLCYIAQKVDILTPDRLYREGGDITTNLGGILVEASCNLLLRSVVFLLRAKQGRHKESLLLVYPTLRTCMK